MYAHNRLTKSVIFFIILISLISIAQAPLPFTKDSDNDGIIDLEDDCDNTLSGAAIDPWGCNCEQKTCEWEENNSCRIECGGPKATCNYLKPDNTDCGDNVTCPGDICKGNVLYDYPSSSKGQCTDGVCIENKCEPEIVPTKECVNGSGIINISISCTGLTKSQCKRAENCKPRYIGFWIFRIYIGCVPKTPVPAQNMAPVAVISSPQNYQNFTVNEMMTFNASQSYDPNNDSLTFHWNFGDEILTQGETTTHSYTIVGIYTLTLTVSDGELNDTKSVTINIIEEQLEQELNFTSAQWSETSAGNGTRVMLMAGCNNCEGDEITFTIFENDVLLDDETSVLTATVVNSVAQVSWKALWQSDGLSSQNNPEYYFTANVESYSIQSGELEVYIEEETPALSPTIFTGQEEEKVTDYIWANGQLVARVVE